VKAASLREGALVPRHPGSADDLAAALEDAVDERGCHVLAVDEKHADLEALVCDVLDELRRNLLLRPVGRRDGAGEDEAESRSTAMWRS
jgi:hypothetical protein